LWARVVRTSPAAVAFLPPSPAARPIASLTLNGARCISRITIRRRISRSGCMRMIPTSGSTSSSAPSSLAATNCMSQAFKVRARSLLRTFAMLIRQGRDRGLTPAQGEPRLRLQRLHRQQRRHLERGLLQHPGLGRLHVRAQRRSDHKAFFCRGSCQLPLQRVSGRGVSKGAAEDGLVMKH